MRVGEIRFFAEKLPIVVTTKTNWTVYTGHRTLFSVGIDHDMGLLIEPYV